MSYDSGKCESVGAGELREPITIETYTDGKDNQGAPVIVWSELATVMAKVEWMTGDEVDSITRETNETQVNFWIRTIEAVNTKNRIVFDGDTFDIKGILLLGTKNMFSKIMTILVE